MGRFLPGHVVRKWAVVVTFAVVCVVFISSPPARANGFEARGTEPVEIIGADGPVARYMHRFSEDDFENTFKTFLHVVDPLNGKELTSDPRQGGKYPHHRGIFIGWNNITVDGESYDLWHMGDGERIVHVSFDGSLADFSETHTLRSINHWQTPEGRTLIEETREYRFAEPPTDEGIVQIDVTSTLEAVASSDVALRGDPEHAGTQYRPHDDVAANQSATYIFPEGAFDSESPSNDEINSKEGLPWVAQTHTIRGEQFCVQLMNHPDNPDDSVFSAYRNYGRFGPYFERTLSPGESITVSHRVIVKRGAAPDRSVLESLYQNFADSAVKSP